MTPEQLSAVFTRKGTDGLLAALGLADRAAASDWALGELIDAIRERDADTVEAALTLGGVLGSDAAWERPVVALLGADRHVRHEEAASMLADIGTAASVPALVRSAHHVLACLAWDENRAPAVKAVHSLGRIEGAQAETPRALPRGLRRPAAGGLRRDRLADGGIRAGHRAADACRRGRTPALRDRAQEAPSARAMSGGKG